MSPSLLQEYIFLARCCLVLGDQLSDSLSSLNLLEPEDVVLMAEVWSEASYVKHHKQKIALVFSAMRHFADALTSLRASGDLRQTQRPSNTQSLVSEVHRAQDNYQFDAWYVTEPGEWRPKQELESLVAQMKVPSEVVPDDRFPCLHREFEDFPRTGNSLGWSTLSEDPTIDRPSDGRKKPCGRAVELRS